MTTISSEKPLKKFMITESPERLLVKLSAMCGERFETLEEATTDIEVNIENKLKDFLNGIGIRASVKADRKSLPVKDSMKRRKYFTSWGNSIIETNVLERMFIREILNKGCGKLRFFVDLQLQYDENGAIYAFDYVINWYEHGND